MNMGIIICETALDIKPTVWIASDKSQMSLSLKYTKGMVKNINIAQQSISFN